MTAFTLHALPIVLSGLLLKGTLLLLIAWAACRLLGTRSSAATRHLLWSSALGGVLFLPLLSLTMSPWNVIWTHPVRTTPTVQPQTVSVTPPVMIPHVIKVGIPTTRPAIIGPQKAVPSDPVITAPTQVISRHPHPNAQVLAVIGMCVWLIGLAVVLAQVAVGMRRIGLARRQAEPLEGTARQIADAACREIGLRRRITFLQATTGHGIAVPVTWGIRHPIILLPAQSSTWSEGCLRAALLHELAHIQRWDWPTQMMTRLTCALCWWHPLVWRAAGQARTECERACDDCVLQAGIRPADYAQQMVEVIRSIPQGVPSRTIAIAMAQPSEVEGRLRAVLAKGQVREPMTQRRVIVVTAALSLLLLPLAALHLKAQTPQTSRKLAAGSPILRRTPKPHEMRVTRPLGQDRDKDQLVPAAAGRARFPGGVTVTISGISTATDQGQQWWDAMGKRLAAAPCDWPTEPPQFAPHPASGETVRNIAIGVDNPTPELVDVRWNFLPTVPNVAMQVGRFIQGKGWYAIQAILPQTQDHGTVRVGVASGPWTTAAAHKPDITGAMELQAEATLPSWQVITDADSADSLLTFGGTHFAAAVVVEDRWTTLSQQIVAVDRAGHIHTGLQWSPDIDHGVQTTKASFDLSPSQITEFRLQTRPFRWAEFRDVPLMPRSADAPLALSAPTVSMARKPSSVVPALTVDPSVQPVAPTSAISYVPNNGVSTTLNTSQPTPSEAATAPSYGKPAPIVPAGPALVAPLSVATDADPDTKNEQEELERVTRGYRAGINTQAEVDTAKIALAQAHIHSAIVRDQFTGLGPDLATVVAQRQQLLDLTEAQMRAGINNSDAVNSASAALAEAQSCEDLYAVVTARQNALALVTVRFQNGVGSPDEKSSAEAALQKAERFFIESVNN